MSVDRSHDERNAQQRARLAALATRGQADLDRDLGGGWTIAAALAHTGFWDRLALERLKAFERAGLPATQLPFDFDMLNDALTPTWLAVPAKAAVQEAIAAAEAVDQHIRDLPDQTIEAYRAAVGSGGFAILLERSRHRGEHADQIERALA
jgi:hypothetical protein